MPDRGGGYFETAARALPDAVRVADRWHLLKNASAAFSDAVRRSMGAIRRILSAAMTSNGFEMEPPIWSVPLWVDDFRRRF